MIFLPANRYVSLDVKQNRISEKNNALLDKFIFYYSSCCCLFYASIAKFYPDWLDGTFTKTC